MSRILSALLARIQPQDMATRPAAAGTTRSSDLSRTVRDGVDRGVSRALEDLVAAGTQRAPATRTGQPAQSESPYSRTGQPVGSDSPYVRTGQPVGSDSPYVRTGQRSTSEP
jgi:hypothetical protein